MTNEKVIEILEEVKLNNDSLSQYFKGFDEAFEIAINSIKKQIPKKPIPEDCFTCPSCEGYLIYGDKYCQECGQLIDWDLEGEDDDNT